MEINKKLFEDVLSGKLKGTFILRNGEEINSNELTRNNSHYSKTHPYKLLIVTYTSSGLSSVSGFKYYDDIINFIPNTDTKENELTIEIPNDKTVDWDESKKQNKIVLKDKQLTYNDIIKDILNKHRYEYISPNGEIFLTNHKYKCLEAKNKLTTVAKYLNDGWKPSTGDIVFTLTFHGNFENSLVVGIYYFGNGENQIIFKNKKNAQQAIEILGEETVKLALEPLGI